MRISDEEFAKLDRIFDFGDYYDRLGSDEMMDELSRLHTEGSVQRCLNQHCAMFSRMVHLACEDQDLFEWQRSAMICSIGQLRQTIYDVILPLLPPERKCAVDAAIASSEEFARTYGHYPRAADMIIVQARNPSGPYELGLVGEIMQRER